MDLQGTDPLQKQLQDAIHSDPLLEGAKTLENFAYSTPGRNRQMGTLGHNLTTDYLVKELQKMDGYYNVEVQRFWDPVMLNGTGTLKLDGTLTAANIFDYSASGNVSAPLLLMNTTGCTAVSVVRHTGQKMDRPKEVFSSLPCCMPAISYLNALFKD